MDAMRTRQLLQPAQCALYHRARPRVVAARNGQFAEARGAKDAERRVGGKDDWPVLPENAGPRPIKILPGWTLAYSLLERKHHTG